MGKKQVPVRPRPRCIWIIKNNYKVCLHIHQGTETTEKRRRGAGEIWAGGDLTLNTTLRIFISKDVDVLHVKERYF